MPIHTPDRTLALAGVMQAAALVNHIARGRWIDPIAFSTSINSLFVFDPKDVLNVYGDHISHLQFGLRRITTFFPKPDKQHDAELARYLFSTLLLTRVLKNDKSRLQAVASAIETVSEHHKIQPFTEEQLCEKLSYIYLAEISTLKRRIHIIGNREMLKQAHLVSRIRALLLAGIRAALLWDQVGGRLWHLWWGRTKMAEQARELLNKAITA